MSKRIEIDVRILDSKSGEMISVRRCIDRDLFGMAKDSKAYAAMHFHDALDGVLAAEAEQT